MLIALGHTSGQATVLHRALALLERHFQKAEALGFIRLQAQIQLLQALTHDALGDSSQAQACLGRALALAGPEGHVRIFVDEGEPMRLLLLELRSKIDQRTSLASSAYLDKLLSAFGVSDAQADRAQPSPVAIAQSKIQTPVEPLSERELEILQLIAQGLNNREIADKLVVAQSTVKKHINNIFGKLDATHRAQAIAHARELRLL